MSRNKSCDRNGSAEQFKVDYPPRACPRPLKAAAWLRVQLCPSHNSFKKKQQQRQWCIGSRVGISDSQVCGIPGTHGAANQVQLHTSGQARMLQSVNSILFPTGPRKEGGGGRKEGNMGYEDWYKRGGKRRGVKHVEIRKWY